jgi:YbbR domain-containing protein
MDRILSLVRHNFPIKFGAFLIAIIIWTMVNRALGPASTALPEERTVLKQVPVYVLGRADIQGELILKPDVVDVSIRGTPEGVRLVKAADVRLYVDIAGLRGKARDTRRVQWSIRASGVQVDWTSPSVVEVELR